ncbi:hypothetical protein L3X38_001121 [Prunus dulcis]|uniref:F-box domain-containing protein n=1 Tax=Prunus dulcis TaxID=3755 RepID=A0AAD4ZJL8_PRUDU|nr:hypothetical protein L3X38_001121 [Prunus dulcis]
MADKTKHSRTSWSQLPIELFELILSKLSPGNILRLEAVCRPWLKAIKCISQSSPSFTCLPEPPRLLVFQDEDEDGVSQSAIQLLLPQLNTFLYSIDPEIIPRKSARLWRRRMPKVALPCRPTCGNKNNIGVLLMYNYKDGCNCLAFWTPADNNWTKLDGQKRYLDVTSDGNCC